MFEGLLESLLKSILGEYIENLDPQKLSISIWSGHVSLRDLRLRSDLFHKLNLPFDLKLGIIKKLQFDVPWARLASSPVVCKLDQLFLIIKPQKEADWQMQDATNYQYKSQKLEEIIQRHIAEVKAALAQQIAENLDSKTEQSGYFERYVTRIKDNLQVQISNIHIRLEDVNGFDRMCLGVTLQELSLSTVERQNSDFSTDEEDQPVKPPSQNFFFDRTLKEFRGKPLHKQLVVKGFAIYIQQGQDAQLLTDLSPPEKDDSEWTPESIQSQDLDLLMQDLNTKVYDEHSDFNAESFIIKPQALVAKMIQQTKDLSKKKKKKKQQIVQIIQKPKPEIALDIKIEFLTIKIQKNQYRSAFKLAEILRRYRIKHEMFNRFKKYKHLRPLYSILEKRADVSFENAMNPEEEKNESQVIKAWWKYAITCVIKDNRQAKYNTWNEFQICSEKKQQYKSVTNVIFSNMLIQYQENEEKMAKQQKEEKNKSKKVVKKEDVLKFQNDDHKRVLCHIVEATSIQEMEGWLKDIIQREVFDNQQKSQIVAIEPQVPLETATTAVKQSYSASIYSYISAWGGSSDQLKAAEEAVEAVTQAEADIEDPSQFTSIETEETESILTTEPNEEEEDPIKEPETNLRIRFKISEASLIIEQITEKHSILMYLKNVVAKFHDKKGQKTFCLQTQDCGINQENKPLIQVNSDPYAWRFELTISNESRQIYESKFESKEFVVFYEAEVIQNLSKFFTLDEGDDLRAQALEKITMLSEQSQMNLRELIQQQRVSKIELNWEKITIIMPFKSHNSLYVGEPEHLRDRVWHLSITDATLRTLETTSIEDIYEKIQISLGAIGLKYSKRNYPILLDVVEDFEVSLLIKLKSKLKSIIKKAETPEEGEDCPEVVVESYNGVLPSVNLNLTPDSYNALVNIYSILSPEATKAEVISQFKEKKSLLQSSSFSQKILTSGVRETRITNNWHNFFVVLSGSYIYFYRDEQDLMPYHYIYLMSISHQKKKTNLILRGRYNEQIFLDFGQKDGMNELQSLINEKQKEFRLGEEVQEQTASVLTQFTSESVQLTSFKLALLFQGIDIRLFRDDFDMMNDPDFDSQSHVWCSVRADKIGLDLVTHPFDNLVEISIEQIQLSEKERLKREVLLIDKPSLISYKSWSLNAPTIGDSEAHALISLGGQPILLYDPIFINEITKYFRNMIDQSAESAHQILQELQEPTMIDTPTKVTQTCLQIKLILMKTELLIQNGLRLICLHHNYIMLPVMELNVGSFYLRYDMLFDHANLEGKLDQATLNDLTMWPRTNNPFVLRVTQSLRSYVRDLPRQEMIGIMDGSQPSGVNFQSKMFYETCPLKGNESSETSVNFENIRLQYFQEQFLRFLSYYNERFMWAFTCADPYEAYQEQVPKDDKTLGQLNLDMDLQICFKKSAIQLKERPYLNQQVIDLKIDSIKLSFEESVVKGRHKSQPSMEMLMTKMTAQLEKVSVYFTGNLVSNDFNITFSMIYPNYSKMLEKISSNILDKSSEIVIKFSPTVKFNLSQELYTFIMRCNSLNICYFDPYKNEYNFSQVNEIFQSTEPILYMKTKIEIEKDLVLILEQDSSELVEMRLRNAEKKEYSKTSKIESEIILIDLFLDGSMKILMKMGIPTILSPSENSKQSRFVTKNLLMGTEDDPHVFNFDTFDENQPMSEKTCGKFLFKLNWAANGQQIMECKIDKIKIFIRPFYFLKISHFFGYGYPEFDLSSPDKPNDYETDFEKFPVQKMRLEILDSLICLDSFNFENPDNPQDLRQSTLTRSTQIGRKVEEEQMTTIVAKTQKIEYTYSREQVLHIKEQLYQKFREFNPQKEESKQQDENSEMSFTHKIEKMEATEVACQNYLRMMLQIKQFSPYICDNSDLDNFGFANIPKRQLICPMDFTFSHGKLLKIEWHPDVQTCFQPIQKNEFLADKTLIKVTFSDILILSETSKIMLKSQQKYQDYLVQYLAKKRKVEIEENFFAEKPRSTKSSFLGLKRESFHSFASNEEEQIKQEATQVTAQMRNNFLNYMTGFTTQKVAPSEDNSQKFISRPISQDASHNFNGSQRQRIDSEAEFYSIKGTEECYNRADTIVDMNRTTMEVLTPDFNWKVDYDEINPAFKMSLNMHGIHMLIINDSNKVFYPILQTNIEKIAMNIDNNRDGLKGETDIKLMISYYNNGLDVWEPFLERTNLKLTISQDRFQTQLYAGFTTPVNINLSEELFQNVLPAFRVEKKKVAPVVKNSLRVSQVGSLQTPPKINLEFKVTPYKIVNMTSKPLVIKRNNMNNVVFYKKSKKRFQNNLVQIAGGHEKKRSKTSQVPSKYHLQPGQSADYEVDYEEEAQMLIMSSKDDLVRKKDHIDIIFEAENEKISAYNLANLSLHQHPFSPNHFDFIIFGMKMEQVEKTFLLRNPFIIYNKTDLPYMLKIIRYQSSEEKLVSLEPGQGYPLSHQELKASIMFSTLSDFQQDCSPEIWSSHFKVSNFFQKHDISKKKFFVYHSQKFSMVFVQPANFGPAWDICIKVPLIITNNLPFNLMIRTRMVRKYVQPKSILLSSQAKKEIVHDDKMTEKMIQKQESQHFYNFNLDGDVQFQFNLEVLHDRRSEDQELLMNWGEFVLQRGDYKNNDKFVQLVDKSSGQILELGAKIKSTSQTDLQITFYAQNCIINNTDQNIVFLDEKKQKLACQNSLNNSVIPVSGKIQKVFAQVQDTAKKNYSQGFPISIYGISNKISIQKDKTTCYEFIVNTSMVAQNEIFTALTTINPQYVVCNQTEKLLFISQFGYQDRNAEVIPHGSRIPIYWSDIKGQQRLVFKLANQNEEMGFDENSFEWSKKIKPMKIGRISILCRGKDENQHVVVIKQVDKDTQTIYIIFKIENPEVPTYRIENLSQQIQMEYFQTADHREVLQPGLTTIFSWSDPESGKKLLKCNLDLAGKIIQKLEIDLDNLDYSQTFNGRFATMRRKLTLKKKHQPDSEEFQDRVIKIEIVTNGFTKTLRLTERSKDEIIPNDIFTIKNDQLVEIVSPKGPERENKFQMDIANMHISCIARNKNTRREFLLAYLGNIEFLVIESDQDRNLQLRVAHFQLDNNINSEGRELFPHVLYPKEVTHNPSFFNKKSTSGRRDFFNAHVCLKNSEELIFIHKIEFLMQSAVLLMDDELIGWATKFFECLAESLGTNLTPVHPIFEQGGEVFKNGSQQFTITRFGDPEMSFEPDALRFRPEKRKGVSYKYQAYGVQREGDWLNYDIDARDNPVFIQEMVMSPIDFEITFRTRFKTENEVTAKPMHKYIGLSLVNVDKASFRLNSLVFSNIFGTPDEINTVLRSHYKHKLIKNLLSLCLSTRALGNMNLLAHDLGSGFKDFFYKPYEGFVDGPIEGGKGFMIGTASLIGYTAKGAFGTVSRVVGAFSKSLLFLAGDDDYIDQREQDGIDKPKNVIQGVKHGLKSTLSGVASGVAGMYEQPIKGAKAGGVKGLLKGTAKGLGGVVVKPISGGLDFIMKTSEGAHNMVNVGGKKKSGAKTQRDSSGARTPRGSQVDTTTAEQDEQQFLSSNVNTDVSKIRTFRPFYGKDQRIKAFHAFQAYVCLNLKFICNGDYATDHFLDAIVYDNGELKLCIILTEQRMLIVDALEKTKIRDFTAEQLCMIESRNFQAKLGDQKSSHLVIRVFSYASEEEDFINLHDQQIDSTTVKDINLKVGEEWQNIHPVYPSQQPIVVDGFSLEVKNERKLKEYHARLEHFVWYIKNQNK